MSGKKNMANDAAGGTVAGLKGFLANTYVLMTKTQACHWNATGPGFIGMHKLTEEQYRELFLAVDDLAERIRALGAPAPRSASEMMELATLEELQGEVDVKGAYEVLARDNTTLASRARELAEAADDAGDLATHDMLVHRIEVHDKAAWLLRSHIG